MPAAPPTPERAQGPQHAAAQSAGRADGSYPASAITVRNGSPGESKQTVEQNDALQNSLEEEKPDCGAE